MIQMADTCFQEFRGSPQELTVTGGEGVVKWRRVAYAKREEREGEEDERGRWSQITIPRYAQDGVQSYMCGNSRSCPMTMTPLATE